MSELQHMFSQEDEPGDLLSVLTMEYWRKAGKGSGFCSVLIGAQLFFVAASSWWTSRLLQELLLQVNKPTS